MEESTTGRTSNPEDFKAIIAIDTRPSGSRFSPSKFGLNVTSLIAQRAAIGLTKGEIKVLLKFLLIMEKQNTNDNKIFWKKTGAVYLSIFNQIKQNPTAEYVSILAKLIKNSEAPYYLTAKKTLESIVERIGAKEIVEGGYLTAETANNILEDIIYSIFAPFKSVLLKYNISNIMQNLGNEILKSEIPISEDTLKIIINDLVNSSYDVLLLREGIIFQLQRDDLSPQLRNIVAEEFSTRDHLNNPILNPENSPFLSRMKRRDLTEYEIERYLSVFSSYRIYNLEAKGFEQYAEGLKFILANYQLTNKQMDYFLSGLIYIQENTRATIWQLFKQEYQRVLSQKVGKSNRRKPLTWDIKRQLFQLNIFRWSSVNTNKEHNKVRKVTNEIIDMLIATRGERAVKDMDISYIDLLEE